MYKYGNAEKTILNIFEDGGLRSYPRITPEILEAEQITLEDIDPYVEPTVNYGVLHKAAAMAYQEVQVDRNVFSLLMVAGQAPKPKAAECLVWLDALWSDYRERVKAESDNFDYSKHGEAPSGWSEIKAEAKGGE